MGLPLLRSAGLLALCTTIGCATAVTPPAPMRGTVLERTQEPAPSAPERTRLDAESTARARVVETAKSMIGVRYRYGGSTPDGFDCSGLVRFSY